MVKKDAAANIVQTKASQYRTVTSTPCAHKWASYWESCWSREPLCLHNIIECRAVCVPFCIFFTPKEFIQLTAISMENVGIPILSITLSENTKSRINGRSGSRILVASASPSTLARSSSMLLSFNNLICYLYWTSTRPRLVHNNTPLEISSYTR